MLSRDTHHKYCRSAGHLSDHFHVVVIPDVRHACLHLAFPASTGSCTSCMLHTLTGHRRSVSPHWAVFLYGVLGLLLVWRVVVFGISFSASKGCQLHQVTLPGQLASACDIQRRSPLKLGKLLLERSCLSCPCAAKHCILHVWLLPSAR